MQGVPIGMVLFYLWVIYSTTAAGHLDQAWGRPGRMNAQSAFRIGRRPHPTALLPLYPSRTLPRAFSLHPSVVVLPFFPLVTSCTPFCQYFYLRLFTLSVDIWRLSTCSNVPSVFTCQSRCNFAAAFRKFRKYYAAFTPSEWSSRRAFRNIAAILKIGFGIKILLPD